jgi:hypothetical protein
VTRLLDAYQDPALEIDLSLTEAAAAAAEIERLQEACGIIVVTLGIPRRLSDATREELALDKKRARRSLHVLLQSLLLWGGKQRDPTSDEKVAGAQLDWDYWHESHRTVATRHLTHLATWGKRAGHLRFGKSAVVRITQELDWLEYALRD